MDYTEHHRLNEEFLKKFPLEKLKDMTIEQYTNLNSSDYFCYWVERKTKILGSVGGSNSFKFGIYRYNTPKERHGTMHDDKYAWYSSLGRTASEVFEKVKQAVVKTAECGYKKDLRAIESIKVLAPMIKWKIAFLYSNESLIPYYSLDRLRVIVEKMGMSNAKNASIAEIQEYLIDKRNGRDIHEYGKMLDDIWNETGSTSGRTDSNAKPEETMDKTNIDKYIQLLKTNKNLILTGAPGTGKTYLAKQIAKQLLRIEEDDELQKDKRLGFVQFHPSYDYTDFVEGLRPLKESQGSIGFRRQDGVFKAFCKQAILSETADADTLSDINDNPTVWKVSLGGTYDNPTRKDCLDNGYIRIGWHEYGDIDDFNDFDAFEHGGKNVLRAFQSGMQIGDLVVSCYSAKEIDAIGVVTGEYEYHAEGGEYPRYRNVKWLVKGIKENIVELNNNKPFTLSTVYKANITAEAALKIAQKYSSNSIAVAPRKDIAIFIIDEINRGEISKIFGELFFSIDPGYRGVAGRVKTQYQNLIEEGDAFKDGFYVPENVYIIGTMNDIDRSVESMDFAMRRRFAWAEVSAAESMKMLDGIANEGEIKRKMQNLNDAILKVRGLGADYQIGAAYFKKIEEYGGDFQKLWDFHLKGLLFEYLRGNVNAEEQLEELKQAYDK